jgi:hypothetical protein
MRRTILLAAFILVGGAALPMNAALVTFSQPNASYTSSTQLLPVSAAELANVSSLSDGTLTATFSASLQVATVPTNWFNWGTPPAVETATPRVLITPGVDATLLTITFSQPLSVFGLEAMPDAFGATSITENFYHNATNIGSIVLNPDGAVSALLFAASSSTTITSVDITAVGTDFAIANLRYTLAVPEPNTWIMLAAGLAFLGWRGRRKLG